jgi:outer membrane receptor protein involved in Fe transport
MVSGLFMKAGAEEISGIIRDSKTLEPVEAVTVLIKGANKGTVTNIDGFYSIGNLDAGECTLEIIALSYKTVEMKIKIGKSPAVIDIYIESEDVLMDEVVVRAQSRNNTENALMQIVKTIPQVASGISSEQISKSPDRVASEVVRRVPGVTIIDDRFIIVRGLSQRYSNAWINGMAAPSTESDSRAFPFDLVPGSQIDNLMIYKSPSPEIPGDFSGGFVKITSKSIPGRNSLEVSYATGFNIGTQFNSFRIGEGSATDFLGFDNGMRYLSKDFPNHLNVVTDAGEITRLTKEGFNNNWTVKNITPVPDQRFSFTAARRMETKNGMTVGNLTSVNYSNTFNGIQKMKNVRYDTYDYREDRTVYLDNYVDNQFSADARLGALHNWSFVISPSSRIDFKNLMNMLGRNRLTERSGVKDASSMYYREQTEIRYSSRLVYCGQFAGIHDISSSGTLNWDAGYSYARMSEPDRRIVNNYAGIGSEADIPFVKTQNDNISRYFRNLSDNVFSAALNYKHLLGNAPSTPVLKTGLHGEYHMRDYSVREFIYRYSNLTYEERQSYLLLPFGEMLDDKYLGADKVFIDEISRNTNNYSATVLHFAGYAALEIPVGKLSIYAGMRFENRHTGLTFDRSMNPSATLIGTKNIYESDWLPSVNMVYKFSERQQLRAAYGRSVNRPELRELSPSVYYDFDLFSEVGGNENLKTAKIDNMDLRYEFYPAPGETVSLGIFYKYFRNPIEWMFIDMGGSLRYGYENAGEATSRGMELDVRKNLDFVGLPNLSVTMNVTLVESDVHFKPGEVVSEPDRAMQGQSPYVINAGIYYSSEKMGLDISALYNRIGKRIIGLGKSGVPDQNINDMTPDSYEMPRNVLDLSIIKKAGKRFEIRFSVRDILSEDIVFRQFPKFMKNDKVYEREQTTRLYNQGQFVSIGISVKI